MIFNCSFFFYLADDQTQQFVTNPKKCMEWVNYNPFKGNEINYREKFLPWHVTRSCFFIGC